MRVSLAERARNDAFGGGARLRIMLTITRREITMRVQEVMTKAIWSCLDSASVATVALTMLDHDCGFVPVVTADGKLSGVLTDRDICMALVREDRKASQVSVREVCTGTVVLCAPSDEIHDALEIMENAKVRRLPVVDGEGKLKGIVSMTDVLRHAVPARAFNEDSLTCAEAVGALKLINTVRRSRKPWVVAAE
jgi:CBS domain-containing protein